MINRTELLRRRRRLNRRIQDLLAERRLAVPAGRFGADAPPTAAGEAPDRPD